MSDLVGNPEDRFSRVAAQLCQSWSCDQIWPRHGVDSLHRLAYYGKTFKHQYIQSQVAYCFEQIGPELWLLWHHIRFNREKIFLSETTGPTALIFGMCQWLMVLYLRWPLCICCLLVPFHIVSGRSDWNSGCHGNIYVSMNIIQQSSSLKPQGP